MLHMGLLLFLRIQKGIMESICTSSLLKRVVRGLIKRKFHILQANPGVPVVDNLEDIWRVTKLQRERKAKEEAIKKARLVKMRVCFN